MLKHFADRQLDIDPKVLDVSRAPCGPFAGGRGCRRGAVDRVALATGRKISRQLVIEALGAANSATD